MTKTIAIICVLSSYHDFKFLRTSGVTQTMIRMCLFSPPTDNDGLTDTVSRKWEKPITLSGNHVFSLLTIKTESTVSDNKRTTPSKKKL